MLVASRRQAVSPALLYSAAALSVCSLLPLVCYLCALSCLLLLLLLLPLPSACCVRNRKKEQEVNNGPHTSSPLKTLLLLQRKFPVRARILEPQISTRSPKKRESPNFKFSIQFIIFDYFYLNQMINHSEKVYRQTIRPYALCRKRIPSPSLLFVKKKSLVT